MEFEVKCNMHFSVGMGKMIDSETFRIGIAKKKNVMLDVFIYLNNNTALCITAHKSQKV